jgi:hypothetical protein
MFSSSFQFCLRSGRLIMAGDLHQLPPIISGDYSELPDGIVSLLIRPLVRFLTF